MCVEMRALLWISTHMREAHGVSWAQLTQQRNVVAVHNSDHRVPTCDGVVGEKGDGLAVRWHLQRPGNHALTWKFVRTHSLQRCFTVEPDSDTVSIRSDDPVLGEEDGCVREPVCSGAEDDPQRSGRTRVGRQLCCRPIGKLIADGNDVASGNGAGTEP